MKKQVILTIAGIIGTAWASSAFANDCYCPQGHLYGDYCLVPVPNSTGGGYTMQPALKAICPNTSAPPSQRRSKPLPNVTWEAIGGWIELEKKHKVNLAFNNKTGTYSIIVSSGESQDKDHVYVDEKFTRLACISKETGISLRDLDNNRKLQKAHKKNACKAITTTELDHHLAVWRGQNDKGKWQVYYLEYHPDNKPMNDFNSLQNKCQSENQTCEFIGEFGKTIGFF